MIDLHAHILPGLDDGPATREESLAMAQQYVRAGYLVVVATPHVMAGVYDISREQIRQRVAELQAVLRASRVPLLVLPGAEYELTSDLPAALGAGRVMTLNDAGRHLLVEVADYHPGEPVRRTLSALRAAGVVPVIAHPERWRSGAALQELTSWLEEGALVQVTAGSLTGLFGLAAWKAARRLLRRHQVHFVVTDAHHPGRRLAAATQAARLLGPGARSLMHDNPKSVLAGMDVPPAVAPHHASRLTFV